MQINSVFFLFVLTFITAYVETAHNRVAVWARGSRAICIVCDRTLPLVPTFNADDLMYSDALPLINQWASAWCWHPLENATPSSIRAAFCFLIGNLLGMISQLGNHEPNRHGLMLSAGRTTNPTTGNFIAWVAPWYLIRTNFGINLFYIPTRKL